MPLLRSLACHEWRSLACLTLLSIAVGAPGCTRVFDEDPRLRTPLALFDAPALDRLLAPLERLAGTPAGRVAAETRARLEGCRLAGYLGETDAAGTPPPEITCFDGMSVDPEMVSLLELAGSRRGDADGVLFWPVGETGRLELRATIGADGGLSAEAFLRPPADGALDLLIPSSEPPGTPVLRSAESLVYARLRPAAGLNLARLLPSGGQADRLFALKGRLLEGALLRGTVELAFLPPPRAGDVPLAIGALHHRGRAPLDGALDEALDQLEATWPIERSTRRFATARGATLDGGCFATLPLLPGLAPCWVVTDDALVVGWQAEAIDLALGPAPVASAPDTSNRSSAPAREVAGGHGTVRVDLAGIARRDAPHHDDARAPHPGDLFGALTIDLRPEPDGVGLHLRMPRADR